MSELVSVLGVTVLPRTREELLLAVEEGVNSGVKLTIPHHNLHSAALNRKQAALSGFFKANPSAHIDGMAIVLWGRLLGLPLRREHRVTYLDLIGPLMQLAASRDWQVVHLGGRPGAGERAAEVLKERYGVRLAVEHGYFDEDAEAAVLERICELRPRLILVGMGMPQQELWLQRNLERLPSAVCLCSGGCFDYIAGEQRTPPRWAGGYGLEWFFRLIHEPRRLGRRYLIEPLSLLPEALRDLRRAWRRLSQGIDAN